MAGKFDSDYIKELAKEMSKSTSVSYEDIPKYDFVFIPSNRLFKR